MQYEVTASQLHIRKVIPMSFADKSSVAGKVFRGFRFDGIEVPLAQIPNPALGRWYKDKDGFFYWGKAVAEIIVSPAPTAISVLEAPIEESAVVQMSWGHRLFDLPFIWGDLKTRGSDITVAVIDSGLDIGHKDFSDNIHSLSKGFVGQPDDIADGAGHGTNMAGIIAAKGKHKIIGVAPDATLLIVKATQQINGVDLRIFAQAIEYAASIDDVDIISISYSFLINDAGIRRAIDMAMNAGKVVVAAIGNGRIPTNPEDPDTFPACYNAGFGANNGVIAVGSFGQDGNVCSFSNSNKHLCLLAPGDFSIRTAGLGNTVVDGSLTSIATAFTAGCLALLMSYLKTNNPQQMQMGVKALLDTCDDIGPVVGFDPVTGKGRLNLRNAVSKIKLMS